MKKRRVNPLNLPKPSRYEIGTDGKPRKMTSKIRFGVEPATYGYVVMNADLSQIEARVTAALAGQHDLVEAFRQGRDVYSEHAEEQFGRPCSKALAETDPIAKKDRDSSKAVLLGFMFGLGPEKHQRQVRKDGLDLTLIEAHTNIHGARDRYAQIPQLWRTYEDAVRTLIMARQPTTVGPVTFEWIDEGERVGGIRRPNGLHLIYPRLRMARDPNMEGRWQILCNQARDKYPRKLYGGSITENVVQSLARDIIVRAMKNLRLELGIFAGLQVYDSVVTILPESKVDVLVPKIREIMSRPIEWLPNLPIAVDIKTGPNYGACS